jgi:hypothetical protein
MKDTRVIWPEIAVVCAGPPTVLSRQPLMLRLPFRSELDDVTRFQCDGQDVTDYVLAPNRLSVTFYPPAGVYPESLALFGRPRNLHGAYGRFGLRGPHAAVGPEKLLQMIYRLWNIAPGDLLGREDVYGQPDLRDAGPGYVPLIQAALYRIAQTIIQRQRRQPNLPASERLLRLDVLEIVRLAEGSTRISLAITTPAGSVVRQMSVEEA